MLHANANPTNLTPQQALAAVLADLQRGGVTDIPGDVAGLGWAEPIPAVVLTAPVQAQLAAAAPVAAPSAPSAIETQRPAAPKPQQALQKSAQQAPKARPAVQINPAEMVHTVPGTAPFWVVLSAQLPQAPKVWFTPAEAKLWQNMLAAIGITEAPSLLVLHGAAASDGALPAEAEDALSVYLKAQLLAQNAPLVLALGARALQALGGHAHTAAELGNKPFYLFDEGGGKSRLLALYHPHILLRQPLLKRPAWQTLLSLQAELRTLR